jgi:hypothetical protein
MRRPLGDHAPVVGTATAGLGLMDGLETAVVATMSGNQAMDIKLLRYQGVLAVGG